MHSLISWFTHNRVAANLLMCAIVFWGLFSLNNRIPLEVFPSFELDAVDVDARADVDQVVNDVKQRIDQIGTFPDDADPAAVYTIERVREVISVVIAGPLSERELRTVANRVRDDLEALPNVSQVSLSGVRDFELAIEISENTLLEFGLTFADVAQAISSSSLNLSAGAIKTAGGEVLIRTEGLGRNAADFASIPIISTADGTRVTLAELASINDGFDEQSLQQNFNGSSSIEIDVFRSGNQSAITVANEVKEYLEEASATMPANVSLGYWRDRSRIVKARLQTLNKSALQGGLLVIVSINLISLFAFILVLGIVVDDAIVTGENIYSHMRRNPNRVQAAIEGTQEVAIPVTFGVLTTVAAFMPLLMIEGVRGKIFAQIPMIVIPVLLFSLIESPH